MRNVSKQFRGTVAVDRVSFTAHRGEITGYLGPNGSGKWTAMKMISGLMETSAGEILFKGERIERDLLADKRRLGYVPVLSLYGDREVPISAYSKGMRQKALLAAALIEELAARVKVLLFSSHELETVERLCSHVVILHRGRVGADGTVGSLRAPASVPTLEGVFAQIAAEQDSVAVSREIADMIEA